METMSFHSTTSWPQPSPFRAWHSINRDEERLRKRMRRSSPSRSGFLHSNVGTNRSSSVDPDFDEIAPTLFQNPAITSEVEVAPMLQTSTATYSFDEDYKVAIDFGTTFTTVAYAKQGFDPDFDDIFEIQYFPGDTDPTGKGRQVPTECAYPKRPGRGRRRKQIEYSPAPSKDDNEAVIIDDSVFRQTEERNRNYNDTVRKGYWYGYEVQENLGFPHPHQQERSRYIRVSRMKLLLDNSDVTSTLRQSLQDVVDELRQDRIIAKAEDVIRDYLTAVLLHTKSQLNRRPDFHEQSTVEVIVCVPICWEPKANATMCNCVIEAMRKAQFGITDKESVPKLFMVNEAEAAATYALRAGLHSLRRHETFILLDCGGGTVDAGTYSVAAEEPLRLATEIINPSGSLCGSSLLNEKMREFALQQLQHEKYLEDPEDDITIETIVDRDIMRTFEDNVKRSVTFADKRDYFFTVRGLEKSSTNHRLMRHKFKVTHTDMLKIFTPFLLGIQTVMENQINGADALGVKIDKVVLTGGSADSMALRTWLMERLKLINQDRASEIFLVVAENNRHNSCATGVAKGALIRACNKTNGPKRISNLSFGVLTHLPWQERLSYQYRYLEGPMREGKKRLNTIDGQYWIEDTIRWVIKKGEGELASKHKESFKQQYVFERVEDNWIQNEDLYVSDKCTESFYQKTHTKNKGKFTKIGKIVLNLNALKQCVSPEGGGSSGGKMRYTVEVLVEIVVIDRHMEFTVRWPASKSGQAIEGSQKSFSLVAAFKPGT